MLRWRDDYSVNVSEIDNQHKKLFALINELRSAMERGQGWKMFGNTLEELVRYTRTHFAYEEGLMKAKGYSGYEEHKIKHDKMTQKVLDIQEQYQNGHVTITPEVMKFLEGWLNKHILGTDKAYAPFLGKKGI